jgi:hypothetical protein
MKCFSSVTEQICSMNYWKLDKKDTVMSLIKQWSVIPVSKNLVCEKLHTVT